MPNSNNTSILVLITPGPNNPSIPVPIIPVLRQRLVAVAAFDTGCLQEQLRDLALPLLLYSVPQGRRGQAHFSGQPWLWQEEGAAQGGPVPRC